MKHNTLYSKLLAFTIGIGAIVGQQDAWAQSPRRNLSLDEAIQMSLQNSKQLKVSQAKVDEAVASLRETRDNRFPDVKASASYLRVNNPNVTLDLKPSSNSGGSGGSESSGGSGFPTINQASYAMVNAALPIFSGFKLKYGIESAKYLEQAAKLDAQNDREEVVQNTIAAYANLYKASKAVELVREDIKQSKQRVTDFTNLEKNGVIARNDLLKVELQESNVELSLLDAENNLKITYVNMDLMLGLPEETELVPDENGFNTAANDAGRLIDWEQTAFQNRKDMQSLSLRAKAAHAGIKSAQGDYYPTLALTGGYIALDIPNLATVTNAINGGVGLQYNLGSLWKTGAKVEGAKARMREIEANQGMLSDAIKIQINQAYQGYLLAQKKIEVYAKAIEQANENYKITKNKYDNSLATTTDLLDADVAQLQAKLNYAYSQADAAVAYRKLQQTAGVLDTNQSK